MSNLTTPINTQNTMVNTAAIKAPFLKAAETIKPHKRKVMMVIAIIIVIVIFYFFLYPQFSCFTSSSNSRPEDRPISSLAAKINNIEMKQSQWLSKYAAEKNASANASGPAPMFADSADDYQ